MQKAYQCRRCLQPLEPNAEGPCPHCGGFYRPVVVSVRPSDAGAVEASPLRAGEPVAAPDLLEDLQDDDSLAKRPTGLAGLDWLLDGGLPIFGVILLCAEEGCGKTTLVWNLFQHLGKAAIDSLLASSEQSLKDLAREFRRCGKVPRCMNVVSEIDKEKIVALIQRTRPQITAIDSIHEVEGIRDENGQPLKSGGQAAVTRLARELKRLAEKLEVLIILIGHMNNDGTLSGGAHLRHAVDATLELCRSEDPEDPRRILQWVGKTRFGVLGRRAVFEMTATGLKDRGALRRHAAPAPKRGGLSN